MINLKDIHYAYPDPSGIKQKHNLRTYALQSIDLTVEKGQRLALLGANGSGKTTLLGILNGLVRPTQGTFFWNQKPVEYSKSFLKQLRRSVATVFQDPDTQLFAGTVYEDVSFGPVNQGLTPKEVHHIITQSLAAVGMLSEAQLPLHMLSFGQKKRIALAGALAMQPDVLLLDEPTAGLDPKGERSLLQILGERQKQGTTILFATHDVDLAFAWADTIVILSHGRIAVHGSPKELLDGSLDLEQWDLRNPRTHYMSAKP